MQIYCPVRRSVWGPINSQQDLERAVQKSGQPFGVDWSGPACETISTVPCDKTYYEYLGFGLHKGIDIPVNEGTEVYAAHDGVVCEVSDKVTSGLGVVIYNEVQHIKTLYWHLKSFSVIIGQVVGRGDLIGLSDNTGYSKGNHLHFELKITDEYGVSQSSIDPMLHFVWDNNMTITKEMLELLYRVIFHRSPDTDFWVGHDINEFLKAVSDGTEYKRLDFLVQAARDLQ